MTLYILVIVLAGLGAAILVKYDEYAAKKVADRVRALRNDAEAQRARSRGRRNLRLLNGRKKRGGK